MKCCCEMVLATEEYSQEVPHELVVVTDAGPRRDFDVRQERIEYLCCMEGLQVRASLLFGTQAREMAG